MIWQGGSGVLPSPGDTLGIGRTCPGVRCVASETKR